jgi:hypothetical protein
MKPQDVALWVGLASSIGGAAVGYGTLTEKVATLEASTDATHLEARLTKLETRIEDNDIGNISKQIEEVKGTIKVLEGKVEGIDIPDTTKAETEIRVLQEQVSALKEQVKRIKNKPDNPLL